MGRLRSATRGAHPARACALAAIYAANATRQGGKKERRDVAPGGDVEAASIEELNQKIATLEKEKNKEEEYRNYMQLERVNGTMRS